MKEENNEFGFGETQYDELEPIASVTFGDGSLCVTDVTMDGYGFSAVSITQGLDNRGVGGDMTDLVQGRLGESITPGLLLRFNNPDSIDVVIGKLQLAKEHLINGK